MMKRAIGCLLLLLISACVAPASQPYFASTLRPELRGHMLIASDGARLSYHRWLPRGEAKAVIIGLHGFNDYSHGFEIPGEYMRLHGIALFAYDQRGFGSSPAAGVWPGEDNLIHDAADMVTAVRDHYPDTPIYLLGESMGGAVAIAAANDPGFPKIEGLILSAPAIWGGETMNPFYRISLWTAAHTFPGKMITGEDLHILASDNIDMLRAFSGDPLVIKATRVDAIYGLVNLMDTGYAGIGRVRLPMLLLYGAHDQVIPREPIRKAMRRLPLETKVAYYPLGYHMLLRDLHGDVPVKDILSWIDDPGAPLPSGHEASAQKYLK
jgi:alpha-beta hydrolase superfamily lysophospholipase